MIAAVFAAAWYAALLALSVVSALVGRPPRRPAPSDPAETYEQTRWRERIEHARRVGEEELAELRRQALRRGLARAH